VVRLKKFIRDCSGATAIEYGLLVSLMAVAMIGAVLMTGERTRAVFAELSVRIGTNESAPSGITWSQNPDFFLSDNIWNPDTNAPWVVRMAENMPQSVRDSLPSIGGQSFAVIGDGNPRLLIDGADTNWGVRFQEENYASSGIAQGSSQYHRLLVDSPASGETHRVQLHVNGVVIEYTLEGR